MTMNDIKKELQACGEPNQHVTGFAALDGVVASGFKPGDLVVLSGGALRPSRTCVIDLLKFVASGGRVEP